MHHLDIVGSVAAPSLPDAALRTVDRAIVDYEAGLLSDDELRRILVRAGVVVDAEVVWLLDLERGGWWCYDGIAVQPAESAPRSTLDGPALTRLRGVLRSMSVGAETPLDGGGRS